MPAVQNAVVDALAHLGVHHVDIPLVSQGVWETISSATADNAFLQPVNGSTR
jgi:carbon-monoxide dehydrogenase large subunit